MAASVWIFARHVLPNVSSVLIVQATVAFAIAILAEAALSYLGLGTPPPTPSWGRMLSESQTFLEQAPLLAFWPGCPSPLAVLGFNLLGDGLRDLLDPKLLVDVAPDERIPTGHDPPSSRISRSASDRRGGSRASASSCCAGQRTGLIGESGSGKTLTALAIMGLLPEGLSATGQVLYGDVDLLAPVGARAVPIRGDRLAMIFQEPLTALNPVMKIGEQVAEPLRLHRGLSPRQAQGEAARAARAGRLQTPVNRCKSIRTSCRVASGSGR